MEKEVSDPPRELKELRDRLFLGQRDMGRLLGYSGKNPGNRVHQIETGKVEATPIVARLIFLFWKKGIPAQWLDAPSDPVQFDTPRQLKELRRAWRLNQDEMGLFLGYTGKAPGVVISRVERGRVEPRSMFSRLIYLLQLDIPYPEWFVPDQLEARWAKNRRADR